MSGSRSSRSVRGAVALAGWLACAGASALTLQFNATVTDSNGFFPEATIGTSFVGRISYDPSVEPDGSYDVSPSQTMSLSVGGHEVVSTQLHIGVRDNLDDPGWAPDGLYFNAGFLRVDGEFLEGLLRISLEGPSSAHDGLALPTSIDRSRYTLGTPDVGYFLLGDRPWATPVFRFSVSGFSPVAPVPEPEVYAGMLAGLTLLGAWVGRRRRRAEVSTSP